MTRPPRTVELLLETLGAEAGLRDAIVGDLAEEYAWIADTVDEGHARRWYRRQAMHAVPLLLRSSLRSTTWGDLRRRVGITIRALVLTLVVSRIASRLLTLAIPSFSGGPGGSPLPFDVVAFNLVLLTVTGLAAGYFAARMDVRAPLVSALGLALPWSIAHIAHSAFHGWPVIRMIAEAVAFTVLAVLGGGLYLRRRAKHEARQPSPM